MERSREDKNDWIGKLTSTHLPANKGTDTSRTVVRQGSKVELMERKFLPTESKANGGESIAWDYRVSMESRATVPELTSI